VQSLESWPKWSKDGVLARQAFLTKLALNVWNVSAGDDAEAA